MAGEYKCDGCGQYIRAYGKCGCTDLAEAQRLQETALKPRFQLSPTRVSDDGRHAFEFGVKIGYWPCLKGPFISFAFAHHRLDLWYGLPSKWNKGEAPSESEGYRNSPGWKPPLRPWVDLDFQEHKGNDEILRQRREEEHPEEFFPPDCNGDPCTCGRDQWCQCELATGPWPQPHKRGECVYTQAPPTSRETPWWLRLYK